MDPKVSQRITKLVPLEEIFRKIDALAAPVKPRDVELAAALGRVLAADVVAARPLPANAVALRDGWAVSAETVSDAGSYAPVALDPKPAWVEVGGDMPAGTDAVLPEDAVTVAGEKAEALSPATPGEGVLAARGDIEDGAVLSRAGERLRAIDLAVLQAAGIEKLSVRAPEILVVRAGGEIAGDFISPLLVRMIEASGGIARADAKSLEAALGDETADAIFVIGGSGAGKNDKSVTALARAGRVEVHGMGVRPGDTAALGIVGKRPVLVLPGRFDAALAIFSIAGLRLLAKLAGRTRYIATAPVRLSRKAASQVGIAEFVPLMRISKEEAAPLASEQIAMQALSRADGWVVIPADSEGYPEGTGVTMRLFP
jgi:molybdopterin biosynthesis enzyme